LTSQVIAFAMPPPHLRSQEVEAMQRRALFGSMLSAAAGAALGGGRLEAAPARGASPIDGRARHFLDVGDGTSVFFKDWGSGPPVVFLSAWGLNSDAWVYAMTFLADQGLRSVAYDRRGHGRSSQPGRGYDFDTLADDLSVLLEHLDLRDATLVGHSMGCAEVVRYLARYGSSRVARAVLVSTVTPCTVKSPDNPDGVDRVVLEGGRALLRRDFPRTVAEAAPGFFGPANVTSEATRQWWTGMILQCSLPALLELHRAFTETDFRPELRAITVPTLLLHGDSDVSTPVERTGRRSAALVPRARLDVYPGAAHGLPLTHVDRLNADLLAFARS
jgi:non-heme chloroperoxidase